MNPRAVFIFVTAVVTSSLCSSALKYDLWTINERQCAVSHYSCSAAGPAVFQLLGDRVHNASCESCLASCDPLNDCNHDWCDYNIDGHNCATLCNAGQSCDWTRCTTDTNGNFVDRYEGCTQVSKRNVFKLPIGAKMFSPGEQACAAAHAACQVAPSDHPDVTHMCKQCVASCNVRSGCNEPWCETDLLFCSTKARETGVRAPSSSPGNAVITEHKRPTATAVDNRVDAPYPSPSGVLLTGRQTKWYPLTFTFDGPFTSETDTNNPFLNYRMSVEFTHIDSNDKAIVPGYFATDGNAANSGATSGNKWRVHFTPSRAGAWRLVVSFRTGENIAVSLNPAEGTRTSFDGTSFNFEIKDQLAPMSMTRDNRKKGMLRYVGQRYLRYDNGEYFLKGGADSPETLLGYADFDGTSSMTGKKLKKFMSHIKDWNVGDPTWANGKGKGLIGALNYLASTGANAFSFLTFNVQGDGKDVWPFIRPYEFLRYDVSKLDQWNIVFKHADSLGMFMHFKTQEIENDVLLDKGALGISRKLYYRELIARFAHHHALNWNLGEENDTWKELNDPSQENIKAYIKYIHELDAYGHPVVIHSFPGQHENVYAPLLGSDANLDGMSLQTHWYSVHNMTLEWLNRSGRAGKQWVVSNDEQNDAQNGVRPDGPGSNRDEVRREVLWGNLMAGGAGVEYYFGYSYVQNDLNAEDWRSRALAWQDLNIALTFFKTHLPFVTMEAAQNLALSYNVYVFAKPGHTVVYFFRHGISSTIQIPLGHYKIHWFNPRTGGIFYGALKSVEGPRNVKVQHPDAQDWVLWLLAV